MGQCDYRTEALSERLNRLGVQRCKPTTAPSNIEATIQQDGGKRGEGVKTESAEGSTVRRWSAESVIDVAG